MLWTCRTYLRGAKGGTTGRSMESGVPNRNIANFQKVGLFLYGLCVDPDYSFTGDHARGRRRRPGALPAVRALSLVHVCVCVCLALSLARSRKEGRESRKVCSVLVRCAVIDDRGLIVCALDGEYVFSVYNTT